MTTSLKCMAGAAALGLRPLCNAGKRRVSRRAALATAPAGVTLAHYDGGCATATARGGSAASMVSIRSSVTGGATITAAGATARIIAATIGEIAIGAAAMADGALLDVSLRLALARAAGECVLVDQLAHAAQHVRDVNRLEEHRVRNRRHVAVFVRRHEYDFGLRRFCPHAFGERHAVELTRHHDVGDEYGHIVGRDHLVRLISIGGFGDAEAGAAQRVGHGHANDRLVLYKKNRLLAILATSRPQIGKFKRYRQYIILPTELRPIQRLRGRLVRL